MAAWSVRGNMFSGCTGVVCTHVSQQATSRWVNAIEFGSDYCVHGLQRLKFPRPFHQVAGGPWPATSPGGHRCHTDGGGRNTSRYKEIFGAGSGSHASGQGR